MLDLSCGNGSTSHEISSLYDRTNNSFEAPPCAVYDSTTYALFPYQCKIEYVNSPATYGIVLSIDVVNGVGTWIWNITSNTLSAFNGNVGAGYQQISNDGTRVLESNQQGAIQVWNRSTNTVTNLPVGTATAMSGDGSTVVVSEDTGAGTIQLVNPATGAVTRTITGQTALSLPLSGFKVLSDEGRFLLATPTSAGSCADRIDFTTLSHTAIPCDGGNVSNLPVGMSSDGTYTFAAHYVDGTNSYATRYGPLPVATGGSTTVSLTTTSTALVTGKSVTLTATVKDGTGAPAPNALVTFSATTGPDAGRFAAIVSTDANGHAATPLKGVGVGADTIAAFLDANLNGVPDPSEPTGTATITWSAKSIASLGDSYSSGEGNPPFDAGTNTSADKCHRSSKAWPRLLPVDDSNLSLVAHYACSGATTTAITQTFQTEPPQMTQLQGLKKQPQYIVITIGGNDVGFASILQNCYLFNCAANGRLSKATVAIKAFEPTLAGILQLIRNKSPKARVVLVGYPHLFPTNQSGVHSCSWLSSAVRSGLNNLAALMNTVENTAATASGSAFVSTLNAFTGHELCTVNAWVNPIVGGGSGNAHPNGAGQQAIEQMVQAYVESH